jgi:hypothetical protein
MRVRCNLCAALCGCLLAGCASGITVQSSAFHDSLRGSQGLTGADVIQVDVALIESPVGDRYLNEELWTVADDQVLPLERKSLLEDNGFRIAQVGGIPPAQLQALLTSERSCIDSRRFHLHANTPTPISLGSPISECSFQVHPSGAEQPVTLEHVSCSLLIVPALGAEGKTKLLFTPQIESGNAEKFYGAAPDRSAWILQEQRPTVKYTALSWELSLDPNEYVVVGACFDRADTLGRTFFVRTDQPAPKQRLLVVRTSRVLPPVGSAEDQKPSSGDAASDAVPPLAVRAAQAAILRPPS